MPQEGFVDASDGRDAAAGISIHGGVANRRFRSITGREQETILQVGE